MSLPLEGKMKTTKICTKCKQEKELSEFSIRDIKRQYYKSHCKNCDRLYRQENAEAIRIKRKIYDNKNKEKIRASDKEYRRNNSDKIKEYSKEHYEKNKEKIREQKKKYREENKIKIKEYRQKNREAISKRNSIYRQTEDYKISKRNSSHKRRAIIKSGNINTIELKELLNNTKHCYWCNKKLNENKIQIDHYMPLSKGGTHTIDNIVISCPKCNLTKNAKDPYEFALSKGRLL